MDSYEQYRPVDTTLVSSYILRERSGCISLISTNTVPINIWPSFMHYNTGITVPFQIFNLVVKEGRRLTRLVGTIYPEA